MIDHSFTDDLVRAWANRQIGWQMIPKKLTNMLEIIGNQLTEKRIPYALIGSLALGFYGLPRYTSDIDILVPSDLGNRLLPVMEKLGYECFQKTDSFAQFDSELGVYGRVDVMFVQSDDGKKMLAQSIVMKDDILGGHPVLQPTDFVILKLMAMANSPERSPKDEADIISVLKLADKGVWPDGLDMIDMRKIRRFAERFGQMEKFDACVRAIEKSASGETFKI